MLITGNIIIFGPAKNKDLFSGSVVYKSINLFDYSCMSFKQDTGNGSNGQ